MTKNKEKHKYGAYWYFLLVFFLLYTGILAAEGEKGTSELEKRRESLHYGLESDITALVSTLISEKDNTFSNDLFAIYEKTKNVAVREKIIEFFTAMKDPRLEKSAVEILSDPYDEKRSTVYLLFTYVGDVKITSALPAISDLVKNESEEYLLQAITALGKIGGPQEAVLLSDFLNGDLEITVKQALVKSLGMLKAVETWDKLVEIAQDSDQNLFMRMDAAEALGAMKKTESIPVLINLFEETDPNLRTSVVKGLSHFNDPEASALILEALKDNYYKTRLEAIGAAQELKLKEAVPLLIYRSKHDPEAVVKYRSYEALAAIGTGDAVDTLVAIVSDKKLNETPRANAATALLKYQFNKGIKPVIAAAMEALADDRLKNLRYALGKEFAKYEDNTLADICLAYLGNKDPLTKGTGLDIYAKNRFLSVKPAVEAIASNEKEGANQKKAKLILEKTGKYAE